MFLGLQEKNSHGFEWVNKMFLRFYSHFKRNNLYLHRPQYKAVRFKNKFENNLGKFGEMAKGL